MTGLVAIPIIPGVNCEHDVAHAVRIAGGRSAFIHHTDRALPAETGAVYIPGGFAYGDYLRAGAIARFTPVVEAVARAAADGMPVLGVCNGFQVLCEAGLLPGALARNVGVRFLCQDVHVRLETAGTPASHRLKAGNVLRIPINHGEGCFTAPAEVLDLLETRNQILVRYCAADGTVDPADPVSNPNGSLRAIAGVTNPSGNVAGMMPHPERACEAILGSADGRPIVESLVHAAQSAPAPQSAGAGGR
ncbi:MAG: phosphoribosylformylglycinamidine synthase subunit PurQ [Acidimicrobiia bacterium]|nr:phosphoribosylformylglycinamidine synthase subunit PurQ [Acidimicrobiia bacterium]